MVDGEVEKLAQIGGGGPRLHLIPPKLEAENYGMMAVRKLDELMAGGL